MLQTDRPIPTNLDPRLDRAVRANLAGYPAGGYTKAITIYDTSLRGVLTALGRIWRHRKHYCRRGQQRVYLSLRQDAPARSRHVTIPCMTVADVLSLLREKFDPLTSHYLKSAPTVSVTLCGPRPGRRAESFSVYGTTPRLLADSVIGAVAADGLRISSKSIQIPQRTGEPRVYAWFYDRRSRCKTRAITVVGIDRIQMRDIILRVVTPRTPETPTNQRKVG